MSYPTKPTGTNILPFDTIFAINSDTKQSMTTGEILDGYNNDGEAETDLTSRPDANKFNMFWYQVHNTIKWLVESVDALILQKLELSGGTMTGVLNMGNNKITATYTPTSNNDLTNKQYVDQATNGAMWLGEVKTLAYPNIPSVPSGIEIVPCDGRALSRTTYSSLFALLGTAFGAGDGSTTFNIPDYRGLFLRGWDGGSGRDTGRIYGQIQSSGAPNISGSIQVSNLWPNTNSASGAFTDNYVGDGNLAGNGGTRAQTHRFDMNASRSSSVYKDGLKEVRPINSNCYYVIRIK